MLVPAGESSYGKLATSDPPCRFADRTKGMDEAHFMTAMVSVSWWILIPSFLNWSGKLRLRSISCAFVRPIIPKISPEKE